MNCKLIFVGGFYEVSFVRDIYNEEKKEDIEERKSAIFCSGYCLMDWLSNHDLEVEGFRI